MITRSTSRYCDKCDHLTSVYIEKGTEIMGEHPKGGGVMAQFIIRKAVINNPCHHVAWADGNDVTVIWNTYSFKEPEIQQFLNCREVKVSHNV